MTSLSFLLSFLPDEARTERNVEIFYHSCLTNHVIREVLQNEIRMQIFVKLGLRPHESSDGPANRRVVLQTENCGFCSIGLLIMSFALAAGCV